MNLPKKKLISEMLENWFVAGHILFGGIPQAYLTENSVYKKYLQLKKNYLYKKGGPKCQKKQLTNI